MKRIIFTVTNDLAYDQRMQRICTSLTVSGYEVELVGRKKKQSIPLPEMPFKQKRFSLLFQAGVFFYAEINIRLFFYLLFCRCHYICAVDLDTILPCLLAGKIRNKKLIYDAHEYFTEVPEVVNRPATKKMWQMIANFAIPKMDLCYTVGPSLAEIFSGLYKKLFHVIRNVPLFTSESVLLQKDMFILYQGALNVGRGLEQLIYAMQQLPIKLVIAGEGNLSQSLREQARKLNLGDKVEFLGYVKPEDLKSLTQKAFIGYNLLENAGLSYYYSLSNKFFDYIHAGVPGLSPDFPEYKAINDPHEVAVLTNLTTENCVLFINRLLESPALYAKLQQNCIVARQVYNWQKEEQELIKLYDALG
ncbi:MAG: glycosyltransferase [Bacteroidota bacterium]|nr:glycosyltransferase [Bacteroidota bacterium]